MGVVGHGGGIARPIEVVNTVLEVADVAWKAMEIRHKHQHHHSEEEHESSKVEEEEEEISSLRAENLRLRGVLEENLKLLQQLSYSPPLQKDCPPDLYTRLAAAVDSATFLTQLESLHQASFNAPTNDFPFREAKGDDLHIVETLVNVGLKEPSWWVWITSENALDNGEELSGIDNEGYVIVNEDQVVDGVSNFIAKCILSNPRAKNITPEELRKTVAKALTSMNKIEKVFSIWHAATLFYTLSTWGLALAGLYRHRAVVKVAAKGITTSGKFLMKAL